MKPESYRYHVGTTGATALAGLQIALMGTGVVLMAGDEIHNRGLNNQAIKLRLTHRLTLEANTSSHT